MVLHMRERVAVGAVLVICALAAVSWLRWHALPPQLPPGRGPAAAMTVLTVGGGITAVQVPSAALRYPRWRMELRRPFVFWRWHRRTWLVAARLTGVLPGTPARSLARQSADVWVIGIEDYCRDLGPGAGPGQPPPVPPGAVCWTDLVYHGGTGRLWWGVDSGVPVR